jgi:hypothetical protein
MLPDTYNSGYSGSRGRRIMNLKPAWAKLANPISKIKQNKRKGAGLGV